MAPPPEGGRPFQNAPALLSLVKNGHNWAGTSTAVFGDCSRNDEKWEKRWISHNQQRFAVISSELSLQIGCSNVMIVNLSVSYDFACEVCGGLCHFWIFLEILVVRSQEHWPRLLASIPTTILFFWMLYPIEIFIMMPTLLGVVEKWLSSHWKGFVHFDVN
jgi:hypothetical protein